MSDSIPHTEPVLEDVLSAPERKIAAEFRDRLAYMRVTGAFPSHLRLQFTGLLRAASVYSKQPVALDGKGGSMAVRPEVARTLDLNNHPLVRTVAKYIVDGYVIQLDDRPAVRRPYTRVLLSRDRDDSRDRITVNLDGSVKAGWPD